MKIEVIDNGAVIETIYAPQGTSSAELLRIASSRDDGLTDFRITRQGE